MVDLTSGPSHQFVVVPVDSNGNPLASGLQISVDAVDKSSIKTKDSTLYVGQKWNKEDNFVSATDEDGNSVPYSDNRITTNGSSIDTSKPGVYEVKYSYKGAAKISDSTFKVTVKEDKTTLELQDVSLYVGQNYDIDSPFKNVTDKDGQPIKASNVEWYYIDEVKTKTLDTSKPGVHKVRIVYMDATKKWKYSESCKVTVKEDKTTLELQDVSLYVGQNYDIDSPFKNVTDKDGQPIKASNVEWYYIDEVKTKTLDTSKPGVHKVRIVYMDATKKWKYSESCKVTVKEDKSSIKTKDSTLYVGQKWNKEDNFVSATDEEGNSVPYSDNRITTNGSSIDTSKPGIYEVKYSYKGVAKTSDSTFKVTVKEDKSSIKTKDSTLYVGQKWNKEDNFVSATDEDGNSVPYSDNRITTNISSIDTSKPGVYEVKYSYKGVLKTSDSTFKVTVKEDKSSIKTKNSIIYIGQEWNKEDNFVSATDEDGNSIPYSDNRITTNGSSIDTSKPGVYEVKYSYKGVLKTSDSTCEVTVVSKEEWFSQIVEAHQSWAFEAETATDTTVSRIEFVDPNLVEIMKYQPYSYRVVYTDNLDSSHNFDVTKPASDPDPYFHCVFLDFREYNQGQPIKYRLYSYDTETEIYVVLENGDQIKVFDTDDLN
ncbi:TPA: bacterial Ig-like domain-containing protein [Enterococcus faecium]